LYENDIEKRGHLYMADAVRKKRDVRRAWTDQEEAIHVFF
jgi:hypothetical protein